MRRNGFTLIELVIVVVLVAIMATVAIPAFRNMGSTARTNATRKEMLELQKAIMGDESFRGYYADCGSLPAALSDLYGSSESGYNPFTQTGGRRGAYVSNADVDANGTADILQDAWNNTYHWNSSTGVLYSNGPNGIDNSRGGDDLSLDVNG